MKDRIDPLDALARYLSQLFDTQVSMTDVFDVFAGIFVMVIAVAFIVRIKRASKGDDREEE
jgi:hypothetical protein